jgi:1-phosphofructokinase family hexose kinase
MFICVSPNPAIDKRLTAVSFQRGRINRMRTSESLPGGKSTHVAMVLKTLGENPQWIGPCGGASGQELLAGFSSLGIRATSCLTQQPIRTNLEIVEDDGTVTEILEPGSAPNDEEWAAFEETCRQMFAKGGENAWVILSGSLPFGASPDLYARLIKIAREFHCRTMLDTSGEPLRLGLSAKPCFVKPNREEASKLLDAHVNSLEAGVIAVRKLVSLGACSAALSLGAEGLLFCPGLNEPVLFAPALRLQPRSTVGCGDSALAGFAFGFASRFSPSDTLRLAAACGAANCLADSPGAARLSDIENFQQQVSVQTLALNA